MTTPAAGGRVAVIINPISGLGVRPDTARQRAELAAACVEAHRVDADIFVTERRHHARELAHAAVANGATHRDRLGRRRHGERGRVGPRLRRGRARRRAERVGQRARARARPAVRAACRLRGGARAHRRRRIDAGELDGHLFFNVAGIGLDADVAHRFAAGGLVRRGLAMYVMRTTQALLSYRAAPITLTVDGVARAGAAAPRGVRQRAAVRQRRAHRAAGARGRRQPRRRGDRRPFAARHRPPRAGALPGQARRRARA